MKKIRFAVVGTNFISDNFLDAVKSTDCAEVYAVYSRADETANAFADRNGIEKRYTDFEKMLADEKIDALYVASPTFLHKEHSVLALRAGKHVLCEKMIAVNYAEFLEMKRAANEANVILLEAMRPDFDGAFELIKSILPRIGKIRRIEFDYCQYSSRYDKFKSGVVLNAFNPKMKNSALADIGIYPLHMCVSLFGVPDSLSAASIFLDNGFEGAGSVTMNYGDKIAHISYSKITDNMTPSVIEGELGVVMIDKFNAPTKISVRMRSGEEYPLDFTPAKNNMTFEVEAFSDMINGNREVSQYLAVSEATMSVVDKIYSLSGIDARF